MNILVVCQYYWPEPFRLADICEELVSRGHKVSVVTGVPNYPGGDIYEGYRCGKNRRQEKGGVKIARTYTIGRKKNHFFRVLNYYSFAISSKCYENTGKASVKIPVSGHGGLLRRCVCV